MLDVKKIFKEALGESREDYNLPAPSYAIMQCEIVSYDKENARLTTKIPVLDLWLNPYGTMQGGMIIGAIDNAVGPLSMLIAPKNMTRNVESKLKKAITKELDFIYIDAILVERKKRRLIFEAVVRDASGEVYATARLTNWIL